MASNRSDPPIGVALAGGRSRRMGRDKADLVLPGDRHSLLASTIDRLSAVCDTVVVADRERRDLAGVTSVADGPGRGPAAGILGAAAAFPGRDLLVMACDLPAVPVELLRRLAEAGDCDAAVPLGRRGPEPLCARYAAAFLDALARRVAAGRFDLVGLLETAMRDESPSHLHIRTLEVEEEIFLNLNRPSDVDRFAALRHSFLRG